MVGGNSMATQVVGGLKVHLDIKTRGLVDGSELRVKDRTDSVQA